jgi:biotin carboxyl carrier protein
VAEPTPERRKAPRRAADARPSADGRTSTERAADHAAIDRLTGDLLPALVAKLSVTGLGEIEVREGPWKVRLRRPGQGPNLGRRATDRPSRAQPGHAGHGHAPGALEGHRQARGASGSGTAVTGTSHSTNGSGPTAPAPAAPGPAAEPADPGRRHGDTDTHRIVATSPAVGIFRPRKEAAAGSRVRSGDALGLVDVLGIPQEVVAPADGVVGTSLVEAGEAVEYGQELVVVELTTSPAASDSGPKSTPG